MIRCLIVDDEPVARLGLERYIQRREEIRLVGTADRVEALPTLLQETQPDLLFLDINLPGISGIEFLKWGLPLPPTIVVTAYPEYALHGYELDLVDYLVKPVSFERFVKALQKVQKWMPASLPPGLAKDHFFVRQGGRLEKVLFADIVYVESRLNYVRIITPNRSFTVYSSLKAIEEELPSELFLRIHKSFLVALSRITALEGHQVHLEKIVLPLSRTFKQHVFELVVKGRYLG